MHCRSVAWYQLLGERNERGVCEFRQAMVDSDEWSIMYKLTPRMLQIFEKNLVEFHKLFDGDRCSGWQLEELIVNAVKSDTTAQHHVFWTEGGHDSKADIRIRTNGKEFLMQIKSGKATKKHINLSGPRHTRFNEDIEQITQSLLDRTDNIISTVYKKIDGKSGRKHIYQVSYIHIDLLKSDHSSWEEKGTSHYHTNKFDVVLKLSPKMSWQVWWKIPIQLAEQENPFIIG